MRVVFASLDRETWVGRHIVSLVRSLRESGAELLEIHLQDGDLSEKVQQIQEFSPQFYVDINGTGSIVGLQDDKKVPLCDLLGFVHVSFFLDEPLVYFPPLLDLKNANNFLPIVTDLKYADTLRFLGVERFPTYMTPFVDSSSFPPPKEDRDIDLLFLGPVIDPSLIASQVSQSYPEEFLPIFYEVGEFLFRNPEAHILFAHDYILSMFTPELQEKYTLWRSEKPEEALRFLNQILVYATQRKRWYILSFLEGVDLKVVGLVEGELPEGHTQIETTSWDVFLDVLGRSRMAIAVFPHSVPTGIGFTPLEIGMMGCAPVLDYRATLPGFLVPGEEVITYYPMDRADIEEKVLYYLDHPEEAEEIGQRARKKVLEAFGMERRAEFLRDMFSSILEQAQNQSR